MRITADWLLVWLNEGLDNRDSDNGGCTLHKFYIHVIILIWPPSFFENLVLPPLKIFSKKNPDIGVAFHLLVDFYCDLVYFEWSGVRVSMSVSLFIYLLSICLLYSFVCLLVCWWSSCTDNVLLESVYWS